MVLDDPNCYQDVCLLMGGHMPSVYCVSEGMVTVIVWRCEVATVTQWYIKQSIGHCMWCDPKSYNRYYVYFCVPWIFKVFTNDPCAGTTNNYICCLHQLSLHVSTCPICGP